MKIKSILAAVTALVPLWAQASWEPFWISGAHTATIQYGAKSVSLNESQAAYGSLGQLTTRVTSYHAFVQTTLDEAVSKKIREKGGSFSRGGFTGDLRLSFQGGTHANPNVIALSVTGPTYWASGSYSERLFPGFSAKCTAAVKFSNINFSVLYDITTGQALQITAAELNPTQNVSCSSSVDWVPILGNLVENFIEGKANAMVAGAISTLVSNLTTATPQLQQQPYFGIPEAIGYGQYVVDGFDVGAYVKSNFMNLFIGQSITMTLFDPKVYTRTSYMPASSETREYQRLRVDFSGASTNLSLSLKSSENYKFVWRCRPEFPKCQEP